MVILAVGMEPNVELAQQAGLELGELGGIKTNEQLKTSVEDVYACGDCAETKELFSCKNTLSPFWHNAKQQGEVVGYNCTGIPRYYPGSQQILCLDVFNIYAGSIGIPIELLEQDSLEIIEKRYRNYYYKILISNGAVVGVQSIGKPEDMGLLLHTIRRGDDINTIMAIINSKKPIDVLPWYYRIGRYLST
jgi:NADH oxidase (H2O2-forming)